MNRFLFIILFCIYFISGQSRADTLCGLPNPTNSEIVQKILKDKIDESSIVCLKNRENDADAEYLLAVLILNGAITQDGVIGIDYMKRAAEKDHGGALNDMGIIYTYGIHVKKDLNQAFKYYERAANLGNIDAMDSLSKFLLDSEDAEDQLKAFHWMEKSAENGSKIALHNFGVAYSHGIGVPIDYSKAINYFSEAAESGIAESQANLGFLYMSKEPGIPYDEEKAAYWTSQAVLNDSINALNNLGILYFMGIGIKMDKEKAFFMFNLAADKNHTYALVNLARCYDDGVGTKQNLDEAALWYKRALNTILPDKNFDNLTIEELREAVEKQIVKAPTKSILNRAILEKN